MSNNDLFPRIHYVGLKNTEGRWDRVAVARAAEDLKNFWVTNEPSEQHLASIRRELNTDLDDGALPVLFTAVDYANGGALDMDLMKSLLGLGLNPDLHGYGPGSLSHDLTWQGQVEGVEALVNCRPSLTSKNEWGDAPEAVALSWIHDGGKRKTPNTTKPHLRTVAIWSAAARDGFPSVAQLACEQEFWAIQNLCRRGVVSDEEAVKKYRGRTAIGWAEHHGQDQLVEELEYLLPAAAGQARELQKREPLELNDVLLSRVVRVREENEALKRAFVTVKQMLLQSEDERAVLMKKLEDYESRQQKEVKEKELDCILDKLETL